MSLKPAPTATDPTPVAQTQQHELERTCGNHFRHVFNMHAILDAKGVNPKVAASTKHMRELVRTHMANTHTEGRAEVMKGLQMASILSPDNIEKAIRSVKKDTVPGADGFNTNFYAKTMDKSTKDLIDLF